jgi:hypothetical protein
MTDEPSNEAPLSKETEYLRETLEEILRRVDALPTTDSRTADEILGYDGHGLPV